jgi:hypothetical protein
MAEAAEPPDPAATEEVEGWVYLTQSTLGRFVEKPRLMADRLRKPPFRFLFDVAVEVARQTGFGLSELFGGDLPAKPKAPGTREEKIEFLNQWVRVLQWALGPPISGDLTNVLPNNIVCGIRPDWTNYMLQCTAAAAWPTHCAPPPRIAASPEPSALLAPVMMEATVQQQHAEQAVVDIAAAPAVDAMQNPLEPLVGPSSPTGDIAVEPQYTAPLQQQIADSQPAIDLDHFDALTKGFEQTASNWNSYSLNKAGGAAVQDDSEDSDDSEDLTAAPAKTPAPPLSPSALGESDPVHNSAARTVLAEAKMRTARVDNKLGEAEDLLAQIEQGFDQCDELAAGRRAAAERAAAERRAANEADARAMHEAADQEAAAHEEARRLKAEKKARRAARKAEEERLKAEEAAKPVYPVSQYTMGHGARIVSMLGDDEEYAWDGDDDIGDENLPTQKDEIPLDPRPPPLDGAAGFDLSDVLGDDPWSPKRDPLANLGSLAPNGQRTLFDRLKLQLKDTYISYLCASMPSFLLKQYQAAELVGCLQFLLSELRKNLTDHSLEDIVDEEPTTLAEDLREKFPTDWIMHVLDPSALALVGGKYDIPELLDTLQSLSQTCVDRLEESLGPIQSWIDESSPLCYIAPAEPITVETPPAAESPERMSFAANSGGPSEGPWSAELAPAPWEKEAHGPVVPLQHTRVHGMAATMADFRQPLAGMADFRQPTASMADFRQPTAAAVSSRAPPTFDATLGPALWEQDTTNIFPVTSSGPHGMRHATAAPLVRGTHTAAPQRGIHTAAPQAAMRGIHSAAPHQSSAYGVPTQPSTSHGAPYRTMGHYPTMSR